MAMGTIKEKNTYIKSGIKSVGFTLMHTNKRLKIAMKQMSPIPPFISSPPLILTNFNNPPLIFITYYLYVKGNHGNDAISLYFFKLIEYKIESCYGLEKVNNF